MQSAKKQTEKTKKPTSKAKKQTSDKGQKYRRTCLTCRYNEFGRCKLHRYFLTDYDMEHKTCKLYREIYGLRGKYVDEEIYHEQNKQVINGDKHETPTIIKKI